MADISQYLSNMFVWADETGSDARDMLRRYGYAFRGERAVCHQLTVRGQRMSSIAAISVEGVIDVYHTTSTCTGETFYDFVRGSIIPNMQPYPNPTSVLIIDNCSIHHVDCIRELIRDAGILLIYLPPYSPDYNPIECVFGFVKSYLKQHEEVMEAFINKFDLVQAALILMKSQSKCVKIGSNIVVTIIS